VSTEENKALMRHNFEDGVNKQNLNVVHIPGAPGSMNLEAYTQYVAPFDVAFPIRELSYTCVVHQNRGVGNSFLKSIELLREGTLSARATALVSFLLCGRSCLPKVLFTHRQWQDCGTVEAVGCLGLAATTRRCPSAGTGQLVTAVNFFTL
jgi:hypothetical protein